MTSIPVRHISNYRLSMPTFLIYVNVSGKIGPMPKALPMIDISAPVCCAPVAAGPMSDEAALEVALRLKALADPARVKIMSFLFSSPAGHENSGDLATALGLTESTISHHLSQLRKAGLVESDRRGMNVYHRPRRDALGALCSVLDPNCCAQSRASVGALEQHGLFERQPREERPRHSVDRRRGFGLGHHMRVGEFDGPSVTTHPRATRGGDVLQPVAVGP